MAKSPFEGILDRKPVPREKPFPDLSGKELIKAMEEAWRQEAERNSTQEPNLRDKLAMAALTGLLAGRQAAYNADYAAKGAYKYADAMLKERDKE